MKNTQFLLFFIALFKFTGLQAQLDRVDSLDLSKMIKNLQSAPYTTENLAKIKNLGNLSKQIDYERGYVFAKGWENEHYRKFGEFEQALEVAQELYKFGEERNSPKIMAQGFFNLGNVYQDRRDLEKAKSYFEKHLAYAKETGDKFEKGIGMCALGILSMHAGKPQIALDYLLESHQIMLDYKREDNLAAINNNIGIAYIQLGQANKGIPYFEDLITWHKTENDSIEIAKSYGNLAYGYQHLGDFEQAFMNYDSSLFYSESLGQDEISYITYLDRSDGYTLAGDFENALKSYQKYHELYRKVFDKNAKSRIEELEVKFDTERTEKELLTSQNEVSKLEVGQQRMWLLIGGLVAALIIASLIFYQLKNRAKQKEIEQKLTQSELKNKELEAVRLKEKLENKQSDLTNLALDIARKNEFSNQLIDQLEALRKTKADEIKPKLRETISFAVNHLQINEDLALLQENVDKINQEFNQKLDAKFGKLTANEKYLAGLIRLNLSNKDIAALRGISVSSAKMNRYRLRKKLGIESAVDIVKFLREV